MALSSQNLTNINTLPLWSRSVSRTAPMETSSIENRGIGSSVIYQTLFTQDDVIELLFIVKGREEISKFLDKNISIGPLLIEIQGALKKFFPLHEYWLKINSDPETSNSNSLLITISSFSHENDYLKFEEFEQSWWIDNIHRAKGKISVLLDPL